MLGRSALLVGLAGVAAAILLGMSEIPLPFPAHQHVIGQIPQDKLPGPPLNLTGPLAHNTALKDRAHKLFVQEIEGSESVAPGPGSTSITMLDRRGYVWIADEDGLGYALRPEPLAYVGPGRPLGFRYDAHGSLLVCDSLKGLTMLESAAAAAHTQRLRLDAGTNSASHASTGGGDGSASGDGSAEGMEGDSAAHSVAAAASAAPSRARLVILASRVSPSSPIDPNTPITYANDLDISPTTGDVFFTDCQNITTAINSQGLYDTFASWALGLFSGTPSGRLLKYSPADGSTHVLATGIWYANGVALAADESFVAVVETNCFKVVRYWLQGPKAGTVDTLVDGLPGFPDGLSRSEDGNFYVALLAPRLPLVPYLKYRFVRAIGAWLPTALRPKPKPQGLVVKVSPGGKVLGSYWDVAGDSIRGISSVEEHKGRVWLGQLSGRGIGYFDA